ncbi:MAG TPA: NUDIX domain-containing protein [Ornithinibacter sp.]|nr:NUDIX domain-containing protein [Ornithinibacter sp.]
MITVLGVHRGEAVVSFGLGHGDDPVAGLLARGWEGSVVASSGALGDLTLRYAVEPAPRPGPHASSGPHGPGLTGDERQDVVPHQRVAAYAVVVSDERLLLTQLADRTGAGGRWNLPGGGLDPGETPTEGVVREVLEETGQVVDEVRLVDVMTHHWVGRSARGIEDYHAVRLIHVARCERPTRPVVHDVGGSTSDARWVPLAELSSVAVVASVSVALRAVGLAGDDHAAPQP